MPKPKKEPELETLETIDPTALANVAGGASGGTDPAVMQALTGVLDSLQSLSNQKQQGGLDPTTMMMMMMMMGGGGRQQAPVVAAPGTIGGYGGYTIDGVYYPFK